MYMDDAIRATIEIMEAPADKIKIRSSYNVSGISFTPRELENAIKKQYDDLKVVYKPDFRQQIADSWPDSIDDSEAQKDWNWNKNYTLKKIINKMLEGLSMQP
jgi:nucleoside-diphosphate-sugar epimerase